LSRSFSSGAKGAELSTLENDDSGDNGGDDIDEEEEDML
jgi:hypothetical protein